LAFGNRLFDGSVEFPVWEDDLPEEIIERLQLLLFEFGVEVQFLHETNDDGIVCKTYQFVEAQSLDDSDSS